MPRQAPSGETDGQWPGKDAEGLGGVSGEAGGPGTARDRLAVGTTDLRLRHWVLR